MATLTNAEALSALGALQELAGQRVPFALALKMRRVLRRLREQAEDVEAERQKLIERYGERDEAGALVRRDVSPDGQRWTYPLADAEGFTREYSALLAITLECEGFTVDELAGLKEVTAAQLEALGGLLVEEAGT